MIRIKEGLFSLEDRLIGLVSEKGEILYVRKAHLMEHSTKFKRIFDESGDGEEFQLNVSSKTLKVYIEFIERGEFTQPMDDEMFLLVKSLGTVGSVEIDGVLLKEEGLYKYREVKRLMTSRYTFQTLIEAVISDGKLSRTAGKIAEAMLKYLKKGESFPMDNVMSNISGQELLDGMISVLKQ